jgi:hypothetical protein
MNKAVNHLVWRRWLRASVAGGFVAGSVDIGSAAVIYHASPLLIMRAIAGGLLGPRALGMGLAVSLLGLVLQWAMSILIAGIYCALLPSLPGRLRRNILLTGCGCGVIVFVVMEFLVVPLSALHHWPHVTIPWLVENLLAMALFGCIIAGIARYLMKDAKA